MVEDTAALQSEHSSKNTSLWDATYSLKDDKTVYLSFSSNSLYTHHSQTS